MSEMHEVTTVTRRPDGQLPQRLSNGGASVVGDANDKNNNQDKSNKNVKRAKLPPPPTLPKSKRQSNGIDKDNNNRQDSREGLTINDPDSRSPLAVKSLGIVGDARNSLPKTNRSTLSTNCDKGQPAAHGDGATVHATISASVDDGKTNCDTEPAHSRTSTECHIESKSQLTVTVQQLSNSDTVDGTSCSAFAQKTEAQRSRSADEQLSQNKLDQPNSSRRVDDGAAMCSEQKQSKTIKMHSNEKIEDKIDTMTAATCNTDGDGRNKNEQKFNKSTTNRSKNKNCDNSNEYETNERKRGETSTAAAANGGGGGISSDSGVGFELGLDDDDTDEDPYAELEFYLEKVKREINEVFEQRKLSDGSASPQQHRYESYDQTTMRYNGNKIDGGNSVSSSSEASCTIGGRKSADDEHDRRSKTAKIPNHNSANREQSIDADNHDRRSNRNDACCRMFGENRACTKRITSSAAAAASPLSTSEMKKTNDWANSILEQLDTLMLANKRNATCIADDGDDCSQRLTTSLVATIPSVDLSNATIVSSPLPASPSSPTSPSQKRSTIINVTLRKATPAIKTSTTTASIHDSKNTTTNIDRNNILKPEKHTYIPLQSFNLENPLTAIGGSKKATADVLLKKYAKPPLHANATAAAIKTDENFPVLKIEEDLDGISMTGCKTTSTSTQTSPIQEVTNKKGSTSTIWTSEESILRSADTVDEDNKSTSSSACEETGVAMSSDKSDSSGLDNDNVESGIGTATPPKEQDNWRQMKGIAQRRGIEPFTLPTSDNRGWVRQECVMTQTSPSIEPKELCSYKPTLASTNCADDPDLLEVLSLCEGTNDEYDINEDDEQCDNRQMDKGRLDTLAVGAKDINGERDDDPDVMLRRNGDIVVLRNDYSDKSLSSLKTTKSEWDSVSMANHHDSCRSSNGSTSQMALRRPFGLQLTHEPFHNIMELPSPSSASLHSGHGNTLIQELTTKSNSAPILLKKERKRDDFVVQPINLRYSRSQSDRYLAEIEAIEACKWLRAAGFPQYAQMYEDLQFPIDLSNVAKDHPFLENDPLQSLYRRLVALNRCAKMRLDSSAHKHGTNNQSKDDSEDDEYALSENWTFQQKNRRWSRVGEMEIEKPTEKLSNTLDTSRESSPENNDLSDEQLGFSTLPLGFSQSQSDQDQPVRLRRTGSERLKDGAKALLRRVESIKSRRRKRQNRDGVVISGPQVLDLPHFNQKVNDLKCVDIVTMSTPPSPIPTSPYGSILPHCKMLSINNNELKVISDFAGDKLSPNRLSPRHYTPHHSFQHHTQSNRSSPLHFFAHNPGLSRDLKSGDESSSYCSDASQESSGGGLSSTGIPKKRPSRAKRFLQKGSKVEDIGALSDSECHQLFQRNRKYFRETSTLTANGEVKSSKLSRGGSLNLGKESQKYKEAFKSRSFRSRSSARVKPDGDKEFENKIKPNRSSVVRWHSFQSSERPDFLFKKCFTSNKPEIIVSDTGMPLASMSCGQLQVVRKLALVTLTGCMERYCPTHRSGWNWELPKFIKKIKTPDYKDKKVFGVPLVLLLQRNGQTLPASIQSALKWLRLNALDQVGIFRKSGVKSRIQKLKEVIEESNGDVTETFDLQQAYDIADMVKQYFRELPDTLLTTKMSDTFVAIFQHLPAEVRPDATQSAILLLPDEHREVLQYLLEFLHNVATHSMINQMTANNLAVCLAPSLFHGTFASTPRSTSVSPRRRKPMGMPDSRELTETRASHDCLTYMIENYRKLFAISTEKVQRCNFGYMEESRPVPLEALGEGLQVHDWRGYLYECTSATIKEGREKSRGWISITTFDPNIDVAHKKVGDGHPLRLWRCTTEVDAPPMQVMDFIYKERHQWDAHLLKWRIVQQLDDHSEIFQFASGGHTITDYCVLRSWRSDLPRGACVIVETSVAQPNGGLLMGGVRGVVLASRYLIEPSSNGRSKVMHLARVDTKGRSPDWYNKCYGHICSQYLSKIRNSFKHNNFDGRP